MSEERDWLSLREIWHRIKQIIKALEYLLAQHVKTVSLVSVNSQGEQFTMDITVRLTDKPLKALLVERDSTGAIVPGIGPTVFTSSDPTVATVDPNSGAYTYLKAGSTVITGKNQGNNLQASGTLNILSGLAVTADLEHVPQ
jgi:hypothetical protein